MATRDAKPPGTLAKEVLAEEEKRKRSCGGKYKPKSYSDPCDLDGSDDDDDRGDKPDGKKGRNYRRGAVGGQPDERGTLTRPALLMTPPGTVGTFRSVEWS